MRILATIFMEIVNLSSTMLPIAINYNIVEQRSLSNVSRKLIYIKKATTMKCAKFQKCSPFLNDFVSVNIEILKKKH